MSLNYAALLSSIRSRLLANSTITGSLGVGAAADTAAIFVERATSRIDANGTSTAYIVIRLASAVPNDEFGKNGRLYDIDIDLWYPYVIGKPPGGGVDVGPDLYATADLIRTQLDSWVPSSTGASYTAMQHNALLPQHEAEAWHWIQSFEVWGRDES